MVKDGIGVKMVSWLSFEKNIVKNLMKLFVLFTLWYLLQRLFLSLIVMDTNIHLQLNKAFQKLRVNVMETED